MKKGIFGGWFKELASLIFTQTVQAFLLAIIMSIIVNALAGSSDENSTGGTYGAGLLAIIALSQFGKIELLIKNIFGVTSQFGGSMQDGKGGLLGSLMALRFGKRILDNGAKVIGGAGTTIKTGIQRHGLTQQKKALMADEKLGDAEAIKDVALNEMGEQADKFIDNAATGAGLQAGANMVNGGGNTNGVGISSSQIDQLISAVKAQTDTLKSSQNEASKDKAQSKLKAIEDQMAQLKSKQFEGVKKMTSGIVETAGAIPGAAAGAIIGLGMGDDVAKNAITGAGIGDMVGEKVNSVTLGAGRGVKNLYDITLSTGTDKITGQKKNPNSIKNVNNELKATNAAISQAQKDTQIYNQVTETLKNANKSGFMKNRTSQDRAKTVKRLQENVKKKIDASNM